MSNQNSSHETFAISMPIGGYHPFLRGAVKSLLAQNASVQIAFLDASDDPRVKAIADEFDDRLHYRRHGPDGGQSDAIIEGWAHTSGEILGWLNADDLLFPGALDHALAAFQGDDAPDLVYGHSTIVDDGFRTISYHWAVEDDPKRIVEAGIISQPSCFFKRDAYTAIGGLDPELHYTMDWDLWIRLHQSGAKFQFLNEVMSIVLWAAGTKTSSFNKVRQKELKRLINAHAPQEKRTRIMRSFAIHNAIDRLPGTNLKKMVTRRLIRQRRIINGVSGDGALKNGAAVPLVHYDEGEKQSITIRADRAHLISAIKVNGSPCEVNQRSGQAVQVALPEPLRARERINVGFEIDEAANSNKAIAYLISLGFE